MGYKSEKMKLIIVGGSGFIGQYLCENLVDYEIIVLKARSINKYDLEKLSKLFYEIDVIINLSGYPIIKRWTKSNKKKIIDSRINTTNHIVKAIINSGNKNIKLINASAIGIYLYEKNSNENSFTESKGFIPELVRLWENAADYKNNDSFKLSIIRIGIVMGKTGGAYKSLRMLTSYNLGCYFNGGKQGMSFIYIEDLKNAIDFIIRNNINGIVNMTAPYTTDYKKLIILLKKYRKALVVWNIPGFVLKILLGKASSMFLKGHLVYPERLLANNFKFVAPNIDRCVEKIEMH